MGAEQSISRQGFAGVFSKSFNNTCQQESSGAIITEQIKAVAHLMYSEDRTITEGFTGSGYNSSKS